MTWVILGIAFMVICLVYFRRLGRVDFWKIASQYPEEAYTFFQNSDLWFVFLDKPEGGYRQSLPPGEWDGPFKLAIPSLGWRMITVYGKAPDYERKQEEFIENIQNRW